MNLGGLGLLHDGPKVLPHGCIQMELLMPANGHITGDVKTYVDDKHPSGQSAQHC